MQRTRYKNLVLLLCLTVISSVAYAEKGDNTAAPSAGEKPAVLKTTSYFQGIWIGNWQTEGKTGRKITIKVGPKNPDGTFDTEYSWGPGKSSIGRPIVAGTVKTKGREDGEKFVFEFNDPAHELINSGIVMTKYQDDRAKAKMEGMQGGRFTTEAYLSRK